MAKHSTKSIILRAFKIENNDPKFDKSPVLSLLSSKLEESAKAEDRRIQLNQDDPNEESDLISDFDISRKELFIFGTMIRVTASKGTPNLPDALFDQNTITGIMFSIGLSLTVVSNTSNVKNKEIKKRIREDIKDTRNHFIFTFLFASIIYILYIVSPNHDLYFLNRNWGLLVVQCLSVLYFVYNFISIQKFNEQIEDAA